MSGYCVWSLDAVAGLGRDDPMSVSRTTLPEAYRYSKLSTSTDWACAPGTTARRHRAVTILAAHRLLRLLRRAICMRRGAFSSPCSADKSVLSGVPPAGPVNLIILFLLRRLSYNRNNIPIYVDCYGCSECFGSSAAPHQRLFGTTIDAVANAAVRPQYALPLTNPVASSTIRMVQWDNERSVVPVQGSLLMGQLPR